MTIFLLIVVGAAMVFVDNYNPGKKANKKEDEAA